MQQHQSNAVGVGVSGGGGMVHPGQNQTPPTPSDCSQQTNTSMSSCSEQDMVVGEQDENGQPVIYPWMKKLHIGNTRKYQV
jgi:hypothetical protein